MSTRKEVFACRITKELTVEANGGFAILLPIESAFNIQVLQQKLIEFIDLSLQHETSRQIRSLWDLVEKQEKGILLSPAVFASLQKKGSIYELIKKTYGLQLKLTKTRGRIEKSVKDSGLVKLESISWYLLQDLHGWTTRRTTQWTTTMDYDNNQKVRNKVRFFLYHFLNFFIVSLCFNINFFVFPFVCSHIFFLK